MGLFENPARNVGLNFSGSFYFSPSKTHTFSQVQLNNNGVSVRLDSSRELRFEIKKDVSSMSPKNSPKINIALK